MQNFVDFVEPVWSAWDVYLFFVIFNAHAAGIYEHT